MSKYKNNILNTILKFSIPKHILLEENFTEKLKLKNVFLLLFILKF